MKGIGPAFRRAAGFTLLEVLVTAALFALVLTLLTSVLYTAGRSWRASEARSSGNDNLRLAPEALRRQIEQLVPLSLADASGVRVLFAGGHTELRFITELPVHSGAGTRYWVTLKLADAASGGRHLVLAYEPVLPGMEFFADPDLDVTAFVPVVEDVRSVEFAYFGSEAPQRRAEWHTEWRRRSAFPELVRIRIAGLDMTAAPLEIIAPIRARAPAGQPQFLIRSAGATAEEA